MSEAVADAAGAGQRLRQGREAVGLSLDAMAAMLRVAPRKLQALEEGRLHDLPDLAFARALALAQCRVLRVDAGEVLGLLPRPDHVGPGLERVNAGLGNGSASAGLWRPPSRGSSRADRRRGVRMVWMLAVGLVMLGSWLSFSPVGWLGTAVPPDGSDASSVAPVASWPASSGVRGADRGRFAGDLSGGLSDAVSPAVDPASARVGVAVDPPASVGDVDPGTAAAPGTTLMVRSQAWVRVADADDRPLLERTLSAGETVVLESRRPLRLVLGNASASVLVDKGRQIDLAPWTRDNVARLVLE